MTTIMIFAVLAIGLLMFLTPRLAPGDKAASRKVRSKRTSAPVRRHPYQSVSVRPGQSACEAVGKMKGQRFLASEAPLFPLTDCGSAACSCKYVHHQDRRDNDGDRRLPVSLNTELYVHAGNRERRQRSGRRATDWQTA